jgi:alcohol dehydrogenase
MPPRIIQNRGRQEPSSNGESDVLAVQPSGKAKVRYMQMKHTHRAVKVPASVTPFENEDTLAFSVLKNIRPMRETLSIEQAAEGCARVMQGKARFRIVLGALDGAA